MDDKEFRDKSALSFFDQSVEYDKIFVKYLVVGSGGALAILFNYATKVDSIGELRCSFVLFSISMCLAALQHFIRSLQFSVAANIVSNFHDIDSFEKEARKKSKKYLIWLWINGGLASISFVCGLLVAIYNLP